MVADDEYHVLKHLKKGYTMPKYEHVMIARQDLSNMQAEGLVEHFSKVLAENDGNVLDTEYWGLKTMAYKVNKNRKGHCIHQIRSISFCSTRNGTFNASSRGCDACDDH